MWRETLKDGMLQLVATGCPLLACQMESRTKGNWCALQEVFQRECLTAIERPLSEDVVSLAVIFAVSSQIPCSSAVAGHWALRPVG